VEKETDSSEWNKAQPNSLSFKNITNTTKANEKLTFKNNRVSNLSLQKEFHIPKYIKGNKKSKISPKKPPK
jgi:hypothetical protein